MVAFGKNCSFDIKTLEIVNNYMNRTKKSFSFTLNQIIKEWDKITLEMERIARKNFEKNVGKYENELIENYKKAKVIKE